MVQKKMTIVEQYEKAIALLNGETVEGYTVADAVKFLAERSAQTAKKNASGGGERKPTKTQLENEGIKEQIMTALTNAPNPLSVAEVMSAVNIESNHKVTSLLTQLRNANKVVRTEVKGKPYYGLPTEE